MGIFLSGMVIGGFIELSLNYLTEIINKKPLRIHHRFHLMEKVSLISLPLWGVLALFLSTYDIKTLNLIIYAAILGPVLEWSVGKGIHLIFGIKLWTYRHGAIGEYTSIYAIPYWAAAGLVFLSLARISGL